MSEFKKKITPDASICERYLALIHRFSELGAKHGQKIVPHRETGPLHFEKLPAELQEKILGVFARYVEVCEDVSSDGKSLKDDYHLLWRMFRKLEGHPVSNLMDHVSEGDVIEIYNAEYIQVFRNFHFFSLCSYTLDDLLARPFWELFRRDPRVTTRIMELASQLFSGQLTGVAHYDMGVHTVEEIDAPGKYITVLENKILSPLCDLQGKPVALVNIIKTISSDRGQEDEE